MALEFYDYRCIIIIITPWYDKNDQLEQTLWSVDIVSFKHVHRFLRFRSFCVYLNDNSCELKLILSFLALLSLHCNSPQGAYNFQRTIRPNKCSIAHALSRVSCESNSTLSFLVCECSTAKIAQHANEFDAKCGIGICVNTRVNHSIVREVMFCGAFLGDTFFCSEICINASALCISGAYRVFSRLGVSRRRAAKMRIIEPLGS